MRKKVEVPYMGKLLSVFLVLVLAVPAWAGITEVVAVSEPFADGQKVTAAAVRYDKPIDGRSLSPDVFSVAGRTVIDVFLSTGTDCIDPDRCKAESGDTIIVRLDPHDTDAAVLMHVGREPSVERNIMLQVTQKEPLRSEDGDTIAPASADSRELHNLVADDFTQHEFKDPESGIVVRYNLFVPKNYTPGQLYPLVMFIHDAGATNDNVRNTLLQGNGATVWAEPAFQDRHEAFVLAPQYDHTIVNDNSDDPADLDPTLNLIRSLTRQYSIDVKRLYATGQSGGAMMSIAMNIKYPDFFAASYIVAGQWAAEKTAPMAKNNLFILVSENDAKAFPGENAIVEVLAKNGGIVKESHGWDASASIPQLDNHVRELLAQGGNIHYASFKGGTLPLEKAASGNPGSAHTGTWGVAYNIGTIREWLLEQRK